MLGQVVTSYERTVTKNGSKNTKINIVNIILITKKTLKMF